MLRQSKGRSYFNSSCCHKFSIVSWFELYMDILPHKYVLDLNHFSGFGYIFRAINMLVGDTKSFSANYGFSSISVKYLCLTIFLLALTSFPAIDNVKYPHNRIQTPPMYLHTYFSFTHSISGEKVKLSSNLSSSLCLLLVCCASHMAFSGASHECL